MRLRLHELHAGARVDVQELKRVPRHGPCFKRRLREACPVRSVPPGVVVHGAFPGADKGDVRAAYASPAVDARGQLVSADEETGVHVVCANEQAVVHGFRVVHCVYSIIPISFNTSSDMIWSMSSALSFALRAFSF